MRCTWTRWFLLVLLVLVTSCEPPTHRQHRHIYEPNTLGYTACMNSRASTTEYIERQGRELRLCVIDHWPETDTVRYTTVAGTHDTLLDR
jgi:hypothetical protein